MSILDTPASRALTDYLYNNAARRLIPLSGTFELSPVCNFSCRMCYVRKTKREVEQSPRKILTLDDWRRIAREAREEGLLYLLLTGGEPFLWPDFWTLYEELIDMGFLITINSNGSLIDAAVIERLRKKPPHQINITLYGASDETYRRLCGVDGVFSKVDEAIQALLATGIPVRINCSLTPDNAGDLDRIIDYAGERKTILAVATYMFPPIRRDESKFGVNERFTPEEAAYYQLRNIHRREGSKLYRDFLQRILDGSIDPPGLDPSCVDPVDGKVRCRAGKASFWITWDGRMLPCGMMGKPDVDLIGKSFRDAWKAVTEKTAALKLSGTCDQCPNRNICHPCAAMAYTETGTPGGIPTYLCRITQQMYRIARETLTPDDNK